MTPQIIIDFYPDADPEAVAMLAEELKGFTLGRALPYGAKEPRVVSVAEQPTAPPFESAPRGELSRKKK